MSTIKVNIEKNDQVISFDIPTPNTKEALESIRQNIWDNNEGATVWFHPYPFNQTLKNEKEEKKAKLAVSGLRANGLLTPEMERQQIETHNKWLDMVHAQCGEMLTANLAANELRSTTQSR